MLRVALFSILMLSLPASAQIYKYTDASGNTVFTDKASGQGDKSPVILSPINAIPKQTAPKSLKNNLAQSKNPPYSTLSLSVPTNGDTVRANNGSFSVSAEIIPSLQARHQIRLILDGKPYGKIGRNPQFELVHLDRGEHNLMMEILNGSTVVQKSAVYTFTIQRGPVIAPASPTFQFPPPTSNAAPQAKRAPRAPQAPKAPNVSPIKRTP